MNWEDFELLAGELFRRQGYDVEIGAGLGSDGGKDLVLRRDSETQAVDYNANTLPRRTRYP